MKATFRIATPVAASAAVAAILLTGCADKPVRIPGGSFVEEPYTGETTSRNQTIPSNGEKTLETEIIYTENDVPVGPVDNNPQAGQQDITFDQQGDTTQTQLQPVEEEQQPTAKTNAPEGSVEYKVVKGDTLWGIGMVYGVSVARLAEINGLDEKAPLKIGQVLMIPPDAKNAVGKPVQKKTETKKSDDATKKSDASTKKNDAASTKKSDAAKTQPALKDGETLYVVKSGDNLSMIAYRHHVKLADLIAANKVDPKATLRIGQTLIIPAAGAKAADSTTAKTTTTTKTDTASSTKSTSSSTKSTASTTTKTDSAASTTKATTSSTQQNAGEGTGGIVEPLDGFKGSSSTASTTATKTSTSTGSSSASGLDPVFGLSDADIFAVPIDSESTLEEVAENHDKNLEDLIRLNPEFKPGQKIPAGTAIKMPLF